MHFWEIAIGLHLSTYETTEACRQTHPRRKWQCATGPGEKAEEVEEDKMKTERKGGAAFK
jgi:hypothetical protein